MQLIRNARARFAGLFLAMLALVFVSVPGAHAALTVVPANISSGVESAFDASALIGVAVAGVLWTVRFVKKGLRTA